MVKVKFKKLHENAVVPSYAKPGDAGMDLTAVSFEENEKFIQYNTGLAMEIPQGFMGLVFPRSSISKTNHSMANSVGVIDSGYRGEICVRMRGDIAHYNPGDRVAQLIIMPIPQVEVEESQELSESDRGQGGFGSTGN